MKLEEIEKFWESYSGQEKAQVNWLISEVKRLREGRDITLFLGHPIKYWIKLESFAKENMYEKMIEEICELKAEVKRLREGIEKHRDRYKNRETNYYEEDTTHKIYFEIEQDEELYKLLEEK